LVARNNGRAVRLRWRIYKVDTMTHALSGMLAARANRKQNGLENHRLTLRSRMAAGFLASAFPDIDFLFWFFGDLTYLNHHRG